MTRFVNSTAQTAADQLHVLYAALVQLDFASGFVRFFNGVGTLTYGGNTYQGVGSYGGVGSIGESTDLRPANPLVLSLAGLPDGALPLLAAAAANRADYFGRSAQIDMAFFDDQRQILTPIENAVWEGTMDTIAFDRGNATIQLTCEDRMVIFDRPIGALYTTEWQSRFYAGDTGLDQVPFLANRKITWGSLPVQTGTPSPGRPPRGPGGRTLRP